MKSLVLFLLLTLGLVSCKDEERRTFYEDMFYFTENPSSTNGYVSPITRLDVTSNSQIELHVWRNAFAAQDHSRQEVRVVVDKENSTAEEEADFTLSESVLRFEGREQTHLPLVVNLHASTGETLVLQLVYEYYDECPVAGRKADRLKISIR